MVHLPLTAYIALGANLGNPQQMVLQAMQALGRLPGTSLQRTSSLYLSDPVGYAEQPAFINAVAEIRTSLSPSDLLQQLLQLESGHGRVREFHNAPRTLDLDLLLYGDLQLHEPGLTVPHPRMHQRAFVLLPLLEIAPRIEIPGVGAASRCLTPEVQAQGIRRLAAQEGMEAADA